MRDLLAGLPRSAAVDVTSRVRIAFPGGHAFGRFLAILPDRDAILRRPIRTAGILGVAAMLLIAVVLTFSSVIAPRRAA